TFVITGDIPAMWNRDSAAQVRPLLLLANEDEEIKNIIKGVIKNHKKQIMIDSYANAFNKSPGEVGDHCDDLTEMDPMVWERKYEIDSLCYPIQLAYLYWKNTNDSSIFDAEFDLMAKEIVKTFIVEQNHMEESKYSFRRIADWLLFDYPERIEFESLNNKGMGAPVSYTGMTWSGFRPSDDACKYGYLIPSNMFAVVVLGYLEEIYGEFFDDSEFVNKFLKLKDEINVGIEKYGTYEHPKYGKIYAYEVDGNGNQHFMDDANVPSLLSAPYLGYCTIENEVYQNTRKFLLTEENPYYYEGKAAKGIGSPHTKPNEIWHISMAIQGMTTSCQEERDMIFNMFKNTDAGTNLMHEGFNVDDPNIYSRPWFSWANSMFAEFVLDYNGKKIKK
ncbi:MAG: glycoside hydrolase family 125 protein, partial [Mycoplasmatales bacterium]